MKLSIQKRNERIAELNRAMDLRLILARPVASKPRQKRREVAR